MPLLSPDSSRIFVFGSNLAGRHGKGAALHAAKHYGAKYGVFFGMSGNSFAIPTKSQSLKSLPLSNVEEYVNDFLRISTANPSQQFNVTQIGCGLAGFKPEQIAPLFNIPPSARQNLWFDPEWAIYLNPGPTNFWKGPI